jgi:AcrR family transcriptional regulator
VFTKQYINQQLYAKYILGNFYYTNSFLSFASQFDNMSETATRIQQEAHSLFMQYGLKSVSMDDIAAKMGISKKTIYQFFSDKEQLVIQVISTIISKNQETCEIDRKRATDAVHEIFLAMQQMSDLFHHMNPSILFDMHKYYPESYKVFLKHKNTYLYNIIKDNIDRGIKEELYREDINVEIMARYRLESIIIPFHPEFHNNVKSNLVEIAKQISTHFLFGIVSQKGYKITQKYIQQQFKIKN